MKDKGTIIAIVLGILVLGFAMIIKPKKVVKRKRRKRTTPAGSRGGQTKRPSVSGANNSLRASAGIRKDKKYENFTAREKKLFNLAKARRARKRKTA